MTVLLELPNEATEFLVNGMTAEIARLREENARLRKGPPASVWTPAGRRAQSGLGFKETTAMPKYRVEFQCGSYLNTFVEASSAEEAEEKGWAAIRRGDYEVVANFDGSDCAGTDCNGVFELEDAEAA
jgi:hypothetical protein